MGFSTSNDLFAALRRQLGLTEDTFALMQVFERVMGPMAGSVKLEAIQRTTLIVEVASSVHLQEMTLRKREIINKINQHFGGKRVVKDIKLKLKT